MPDHDEVARLYGPWIRRTPADAAALLQDYPGRWWIAGGWAIDAFVGTERKHSDLDIGVPREDVDQFVSFVSPSFDVWATAGSLTPILNSQDAAIPDGCGNLWLRASGADPWEYDVLLEQVHNDGWRYKRAPRIARHLDECLWSRDEYLRPEIQLLLKAKHARAKDTDDLRRTVTLLDSEATSWLERVIREEHPEHPWLALLAAP